MKQRILSVLLALTMICTLLPAAASAEDGSAGVLSYHTTDSGEAVITGCDESASGKIVIPDTLDGCPVTTINGWAFAFHNDITEIIVPDSVTEIRDHAFYWCEKLERITLPDNITTLSESLLEGCGALISVKLPEGLTSIGDGAFNWCLSLAEITIPSGVTEIGANAFINCNKIKSIKLPEQLTAIGEKAFHWCTSLEEIEIPAGITKIEPSVFDTCASLKSIKLPEQLTEIGDGAFRSCHSLGKITIPAAVAKIGDGAFDSCNIEIRFSGHAPAVSESAFTESTVFCVYPSGDTTWTAAAKVNGGANQIIWAESDPEPIKDTARSATEKRIALQSNNLQHQNYNGNFFTLQYSSLYVDGDCVTRVEHTSPYTEQTAENALVVEQYNSDGKLQWKKTIPDELPVWGGFYSGTDYHFLVYGLLNDAEDDSAEVIRVVRYTKNWNRIDAVSIRGVNTVEPFGAGSLRMTQNGNILYIHTSRIMYRSPDGLRHQSSLSFNILISDMKAVQITRSYVSHSFNQFVTAEKDDVALLDHGDAYPRSLHITRFPGAAGSFCFNCDDSNVIPIYGETGDNYTGMQVGGFEESGTSYLSTGLSRKQVKDSDEFENLFVAVTDKTRFGEEGDSTVHWLTDYTDSSGVAVSNPRLVKISADRFLLLWCEATDPAFEMAETTLHYVFLDGQGEKASEVYTAAGIPLSDCQPIISKNTVVWYVTEDSAPVFYRIQLEKPEKVSVLAAKDDTPAPTPSPTPMPTATPAPTVKPEVKNPFKDVSKEQYYYEPVLWAVNHEPQITAGTSATTFSPASPCTRGQIVTFLWRAKGCPEPTITKNPFTDVKSSDYFYKAVLWAVEKEITAGTSATTFSPGATVTRAQTVTFLWRAEGKSAAQTKNPFTDVPSGQYYTDAVLWAVKNNITAGTSATTFSPANPCTRGQIVTFLYRDLAR